MNPEGQNRPVVGTAGEIREEAGTPGNVALSLLSADALTAEQCEQHNDGSNPHRPSLEQDPGHLLCGDLGPARTESQPRAEVLAACCPGGRFLTCRLELLAS